MLGAAKRQQRTDENVWANFHYRDYLRFHFRLGSCWSSLLVGGGLMLNSEQTGETALTQHRHPTFVAVMIDCSVATSKRQVTFQKPPPTLPSKSTHHSEHCNVFHHHIQHTHPIVPPAQRACQRHSCSRIEHNVSQPSSLQEVDVNGGWVNNERTTNEQ